MSDVKKGLQDMIRKHGERAEPFAFVGREEIISDILDTAKGMKDEGPITGATYVIQGAPGSGKTALLKELRKRCRESVVCFLYEKVPTEGETRKIWGQLASHFSGIPEDEFAITSYEEQSFEGGVNTVVKAEGRYTIGETRHGIEIGSSTEIKDLIKSTGKPSKACVVVCIDEIQNIQPDTPAANLIEDLHTQSKIPVLLVCAGLTDSIQALRNVGISRKNLRNNVPLGQLTREEIQESARVGLKKIANVGQIDGGKLADLLAEKIATEADRWPKHLTSYLHGVIEALCAQDTPSFEGLNVEDTLAYGRKIREAYYQDRMNASELPETILEKLYQRIKEKKLPLSKFGCADLLEIAIENYEGEGKRTLLRRFPTGEEALEQSLRAGIVTLNEQNKCEIPIPTMADFVYELAAREREVVSLKSEEDGLCR